MSAPRPFPKVSSRSASPSASPSAATARRVRPGILLGALVLAALAGMLLGPGRDAHRPVYPLPLDGHTVHRINALVGGRSLTRDEVRRRYGIELRGSSPLTTTGLRDLIRAREGAAPADGDGAYVRLHTRADGGVEEVWLWPER